MKKVILTLLLLLIGTGILLIPVQSGFLLTEEGGRPLYFLPNDKKQISIGWRHSVELTPWEETYHVLNSGEFVLESTTFKSYGAGTPDMDGVVEVLSNGYIRLTEIERTIPYYSLFYLPISHYYIEVSGKKYSLSDFVPENQIVQIHYESLLLYEWIYLKFIERGRESDE
ncbi:DUF1850 domain-containing protein [Jeotgalibacillus marinus]|uniref:DUF1850 domain-containing protein n=1 Tax=Jeotgalibacillus marinus TaxID=86667 RepID=A0ABV3PYT4_9BACL